MTDAQFAQRLLQLLQAYATAVASDVEHHCQALVGEPPVGNFSGPLVAALKRRGLASHARDRIQGARELVHGSCSATTAQTQAATSPALARIVAAVGGDLPDLPDATSQAVEDVA